MARINRPDIGNPMGQGAKVYIYRTIYLVLAVLASVVKPRLPGMDGAYSLGMTLQESSIENALWGG